MKTSILTFVSLLGFSSYVLAMPAQVEKPRAVNIENPLDWPEGFTFARVQPTASPESLGRNSTLQMKKPTGLEKRELGIGCTGFSSVEPNDIDCRTLIDNIGALPSTLQIPPTECITSSYGECLAYVCAVCDQVTMDTMYWMSLLDNVYSYCIANGEYGFIGQNDIPQFEAGLEASGDSLPAYCA